MVRKNSHAVFLVKLDVEILWKFDCFKPGRKFPHAVKNLSYQSWGRFTTYGNFTAWLGFRTPGGHLAAYIYLYISAARRLPGVPYHLGMCLYFLPADRLVEPVGRSVGLMNLISRSN
jgi:hypothetical protein